MWFSILKVDRFTNEGGFKGLYNEETKEISVNLDRFISSSKLMSDTERIDEFVEVVIHENAHKQYDNIIGPEMKEPLDNVMEQARIYSNVSYANFEARRNKIKNIKEAMYIYFNYAIINEKYAYATGKTDNTIGSIRKVLTQISGFIRKLPNIREEDKYISNLIREMYEELTTNIKREE
jgi:hypothetical protein